MLGKTEGKRGRGWQRMKWLDGIINPVDMSKLREIVGDGGDWHAAVHGVAKSQMPLSDRTTTNLRSAATGCEPPQAAVWSENSTPG